MPHRDVACRYQEPRQTCAMTERVNLGPTALKAAAWARTNSRWDDQKGNRYPHAAATNAWSRRHHVTNSADKMRRAETPCMLQRILVHVCVKPSNPARRLAQTNREWWLSVSQYGSAPSSRGNS